MYLPKLYPSPTAVEGIVMMMMMMVMMVMTKVMMMMTVIMTSCWARHGAPREWRLVLAAYRFHLWQHGTTKKKTPVEAPQYN